MCALHMKTNQKRNTTKIRFSENNAEIIQDVLKKYALDEKRKRTMVEMVQAKTTQEKNKLLESLPGAQISRTAREVAEGKISTKTNLIAALQERLEISAEIAKKIATDLEINLFAPVGLSFSETSQEINNNKTKNSVPEKTEEVRDIQERKKSDPYREPVE